jgi:hypothetical protein
LPYYRSAQEAQQKANEGYTVIAAWFNETSSSGTNPDGTAEYHGHLATVRPKKEYDDSVGPLLANIGGNVGELSTARVFENAYSLRNEIKFYYDPNQDFVFRENKMWCRGAEKR